MRHEEEEEEMLQQGFASFTIWTKTLNVLCEGRKDLEAQQPT